jgi:hypothetical protein
LPEKIRAFVRQWPFYQVSPPHKLPLNAKNGHFLPYPHSIIAGNARLRNRSRKIFLYWSPIFIYFSQKKRGLFSRAGKTHAIV